MTGKLDLPNLLTLSRLPMAALIWIAPGSPPLVLVLLAAAGITDVLDGLLARRGPPNPAARAVGTWLDPVCDKTFTLSMLAAVWVAIHPPAAWIALVAARELAQVPAAIVVRCIPSLRRRFLRNVKAAAVGKAATVAQFVAIAAILLRAPWAGAAAWVAGAIGLAAAAYYLARSFVGRREGSSNG